MKDCQSFTVVSDHGFRALVAKLDLKYALSSRQAVKAMVERRYLKEKEKGQSSPAECCQCQPDRRYVDFRQHG